MKNDQRALSTADVRIASATGALLTTCRVPDMRYLYATVPAGTTETIVSGVSGARIVVHGLIFAVTSAVSSFAIMCMSDDRVLARLITNMTQIVPVSGQPWLVCDAGASFRIQNTNTAQAAHVAVMYTIEEV